MCAPGFTDRNCTTNIDDCKDNICQHGSRCIDGVNIYTCQCSSQYTGPYCELGPVRHQPNMNTGLCQDHDCQNNGVCYQEDKSADYMCKCVVGRLLNGKLQGWTGLSEPSTTPKFSIFVLNVL